MKKKHDMILLGIALLVVLILFGAYCPMEEIIGIPCPGCNMLTALYWLSKGNMEMASFYRIDPLRSPLSARRLAGVGAFLRQRGQMH